MMSGTSLDGTDLCACRFTESQNTWHFEILAAQTVPYPAEWVETLKGAMDLSGYDLAFTHAALGRYFGTLAAAFIEENKLKIDLIGSHGHTVFHQPQHGFTCQIGDGAQIAAITGVDTVCDFRTKDVALGGQGAPLVPLGDKYLFAEYAGCLNLGGIANISYEENGNRKGFDICPANMILNLLANSQGNEYDDRGKMAASGKIIPELLERLNRLSFYSQQGPKSLGREWLEKEFLPATGIGNSKISYADAANLAHTICEHIAMMHTEAFKGIKEEGSILVTGGGAFNTYLTDRIAVLSGRKITVPEASIINYKEALVFGFLAALYQNNRVNIFNSATGSLRNNIGGALYKAG
jgi:anhydro-N-acetylmuramic acid kinase